MSYSTFLGQRVYKAPMLKLYFPFFISGSTIFFLFSYAHTKMMDHPLEKWDKIVSNVKIATEKQILTNAASKYYEELQKGDASATTAHHH